MNQQQLIDAITLAAAKLPPDMLKTLADVVVGLVNGRPEVVQSRLKKLAMKLALAKVSEASMEQAANAAAKLRKATPK